MATDADRKLQDRLRNHRIALGLPRAASLQEDAIETWFLLEWTLEHLPPGLAERALATLERRKARRAKESSAGKAVHKPRSKDGQEKTDAQALGRMHPKTPGLASPAQPAEELLARDEEALERDWDAIREAEAFHGPRDPFTGGF